LNIVGDKLRPEWTADLLAGHLRYRPRQWLNLRMPRFPAGAKEFAQGLAASAGLPPDTPAESAPDPALAGTGLRILEGIACNSCHGIGDAQPTSVFEAPGINLAWSSHRLHTDFVRRWILSPQRFDPETRMPAFFVDGQSPLPDILNGDSKAQIQAIWQHLRSVGDSADHPWILQGH
jgi:mono/diheme cytochrome c family protein